jgi:hypothetical protein
MIPHKRFAGTEVRPGDYFMYDEMTVTGIMVISSLPVPSSSRFSNTLIKITYVKSEDISIRSVTFNRDQCFVDGIRVNR